MATAKAATSGTQPEPAPMADALEVYATSCDSTKLTPRSRRRKMLGTPTPKGDSSTPGKEKQWKEFYDDDDAVAAADTDDDAVDDDVSQKPKQNRKRKQPSSGS